MADTAVPHVQRIELADGEWLEVTERPTHDRMNAWYQAVQRNLSDPATYLDLVSQTILAFGMAWNVKGEDGHELPFTPEGLGQAPFDRTMAAFRACQTIAEKVRKDLNPNA